MFPLAFVLLGTLRIWRYSMMLDGFDTALLRNVFWRLGHGLDSVTMLTGSPYLSTHVSGVAAVLAPLYRIAPDLAWILTLLLPAASVSVAAFGLWKLSRHLGLSDDIANRVAAVFLLGPWSYYASQLEINEPTFGLGPLVMVAASAIEDRHPISPVVWAALAVLMRTEMAIAVLLLGVVLASSGYRRGRWVLSVGLIASVTSLSWLFLNQLDAPSVAAHFAHLGEGPVDVVRSALTRPLDVIAPLAAPKPWLAMIFWLLPFGVALPLKQSRWLLPALPTAGVALFGVWPAADSFIHHYWYSIAPLSGIAAVFMMVSSSSARSTFKRMAGPVVLIAWLVFFLTVPSLLLPVYRDLGDQRAVVEYVGQQRGFVTVSRDVLVHLAGRPDIAPFPRPFRCLDESIGPYAQPGRPPDLVVMSPQSIEVLERELDLHVSAVLESAYAMKRRFGDIAVWSLEDSGLARESLQDCD